MVKRKEPPTSPENGAEVAQKPPPVIDDYDTSDEEDLRNTIGNVPVRWYDDYEHIGYDLSGKRIAKSAASKKDELDNFLEKVEDPDYWRRVYDRQSGGDTMLTDEQVDKIRAIAENRFPVVGYNPYEPFLDIFSSQKEIHPISNRPDDKRSFIPSLDERRMVGRLVHAIKMGWIKKRQAAKNAEEDGDTAQLYDLWAEESENPKSKSELARIRMHLPAPKVAVPSHVESYNPPAEYLFDEEERRKWEEAEPEDRRIDFLPAKYDALRRVPFYDRFYEDRLDRCMDLYLAPRQAKMRLNVDPKELLPDLPNPRDLQPFPTTLAFYMHGHVGHVRSVSVEPERGELLASGGQDGTVRIWYLPTGRCLRTFKMGAPVTCVAYSPNTERTLLLVSCESNVVTILNTESGDKLLVSQTRQYLDALGEQLEMAEPGALTDWRFSRAHKSTAVELHLKDKVRSVTWHKKGDYFATVGFTSSTETVLVHQLSKCTTQKPFNKKKDNIQTVLFHPTQPLFFVATQLHIRVYDLAKHTLKRKIFTGSRFVSCMQLHPHGNNLFLGGLDRTFSWIDLELGAKPWRTLRNHSSAIRAVAVHNRLPLMATVSDDATAIVYHAKVSNDLLRENELIPVKRLHGHKAQLQKKKKNIDGEEMKDDADVRPAEQLAILSAVFHPTQAWLITAGADGQIGLFSY